ncbi:Lysylphosphatidylglycerol biosynthesis bifunctional protein LysX [Actinomyces bovis]|uniref:Lysine--tRNA ligase n=1 Tax=Actinomyces bovis TaxID=1658 RepID=A0ABY1VLN5_9ACTO|nr:lysine--tRNA ligase [Actinomyces bovis]SPT53006.1 Lysylphosphatidylglycerol biosynthesis bifunctional protein LysX [Actinomyces bovis]VEG55252.1 Lysylphosphatidylglycerol biosynthesis bifunctional protein LysX [Actinomyces israelii]
MTDAQNQPENTPLPAEAKAAAPQAEQSGKPKQTDQAPKAPKADPGPGEQFEVRAAKRERLRAEGWEPYPVQLPITTTIAKVRAAYSHLEAGEETQEEVGLAGRVVFLRNSGKLCFVTLQDGAGATIQAMLSAKSLPGQGHTSLAAFKADVDLGDHLFVHGRVISSRRGELSVFAETALVDGADPAALPELGDDAVATPAWRIASKALRPLPKTWTNEAGEAVTLSEDNRVRRRELDLLTRPAARDMVRTRAAVVRSLRENFHRREYVELETPMLQVIHGGAAARPFTTHMNAFDLDLYLRIATEIYLKRAVVGGVDRVFEINRNFRNEGADSSHSPEFTALEAYEAYSDYNGMADLTRNLVQQAARDAFGLEEGQEVVTLADGTEYDLSGQWRKIDLYTAVSEGVGEEITVETPREKLVKLAEKLDLEVDDYAVAGKIVEDIFEVTVGDDLWEPTFVYDFPEDTSPLTRYHRSKPGLTEKWDLYIRGFETATAYSELADPVVQRQRFEAQALAAANGDPEAMVLDEDFLVAMEQGFPPCGGMGMGIDRLLMALTGQGIRETITFPLVRRS